MSREVPEEIYYECAKCDDFTTHEVLKGRIGKASLEGTFRCEECGNVFSGTIKMPRMCKVSVIISDGPVSEKRVYAAMDTVEDARA